MEVVLWVAVGIVCAVALYYLLTMLCVGIVFSVIYGRTSHAHSRRALFSDLPHIPIDRSVVSYGKKKHFCVYLLGQENTKGLVVVSHGIRDRGEGYFLEARGFLRQGYRVLLYDATGSGASSGRSQRGLPQSAIDLDRVLRWAERQKAFDGLPFCLFGHSWGGYAVCAVFRIHPHPRVRAVCSLSGYNDSCKMLFEGVATESVHFGRFVYPVLRLMQFLRFGRGMYLTADKGIALAQDTRFLILHAQEDEVIRAEGAGIYALHSKRACARVRFELLPGRGHLNATLSPASLALDREQDERARQIMKGKRGFMSEKKEEVFFAPIDRAARIALSEPDPALFEKIDAFFQED